ncbi:lamin tail domain-containing protein, partial [Nostocoides japonicum]|uniref:lamin tail domain-containing protein n=1 Tax=Nostocoides japonicum TaxID=99481 RepID=UPI00069FFC0F
PGGTLVISEVYGGGGNSAATFTNDFVEVYNAGASPIDLGGYSIQYASATGTTWTNTTALTGEIQPGQYYLVQEASGGTTGSALPTPDATGTINLSALSGKVALVLGSTALTCGSACTSDAAVVDFVGYGSANDAAGGHPAPALSNTASAQRTTDPFTNTADNAADFTVAAPTPKAAPAGGTTNPCSVTPLPEECVPGDTTIQDVQGDGFVSPLDDTTVSKVPGIVTAVRSSGSSRGFWIQDPSPDTSDASASSGVFVYSTAPVSVGDAVLVTGKVQDYYTLAPGETLSTTSSLSVTEITPTLVTTVTRGNALPAALDITPTTVPATYATTTPTGNVESIATVQPSRSALEFWEAHEGMRVTVDDARVVGPGKTQYGEIYVTTKPDQHATPRGGTYIDSYEMPSGRLLVMPVNGVVPAANVGDELAGATTGPVDWSTFGGYAIAATTLGTYVDNHLQPTTASPQAADQLAVATYNVENLAPSDPASKFATLGAGVVTNLKSPDIVSVEEIQDNSGATDDGTVDADQTLAKLTAAITAAGGPAYQWAQINPVNDEDGGQPGGNIRSVFLYNPDRVTFVDKPAGTSTEAVTVSTAPDGTPDLSVNPGRVDPTSSAWDDSRKPLAGEFVFQGRKVVVVANHFDSKGGDQNADGRYQPPTRSSEVQRTQQATVLRGFVEQVLTADPSANIVLAGDFNDYQFSGPVKTLTDDGGLLTDLIGTLPVDERYTYNYNGVSQVLDHIFLSKAITDVQYDVVHVNSEFAVQSSDHDPQVTRLRLAAQPPRHGTLTLDPRTVRQGGTSTATLTGWDPGTELTIRLDRKVLGTVTTDDHGSATYAVPVAWATRTGTRTVTASAADGVSASARLTVTAAIKVGHVQVSPGRQHAGLQVKVTLRGWAKQVRVRISLDGGATLANPRTDAHGKASAIIRIPRTATVGVHQVLAQVSDGGSASDTLTVLRR